MIANHQEIVIISGYWEFLTWLPVRKHKFYVRSNCRIITKCIAYITCDFRLSFKGITDWTTFLFSNILIRSSSSFPSTYGTSSICKNIPTIIIIQLPIQKKNHFFSFGIYVSQTQFDIKLGFSYRYHINTLLLFKILFSIILYKGGNMNPTQKNQQWENPSRETTKLQ